MSDAEGPLLDFVAPEDIVLFAARTLGAAKAANQ